MTMFKLLTTFFVTLFLLACSDLSDKNKQSSNELVIDLESGNYQCIRMETTLGSIYLALDKVKAPVTVKNFMDYTHSGFYEGTIFHRVIDGFMIQGGGWTTDLDRKETGEPILNEADNGLKNIPGSIAMARTMEPHSATAQFFININNNRELNHTQKTTRGWGYTVFGQVINGMNVVDKIRQVPTGPKGILSQDVPIDDIIINNVSEINCASLKKQST